MYRIIILFSQNCFPLKVKLPGEPGKHYEKQLGASFFIRVTVFTGLLWLQLLAINLMLTLKVKNLYDQLIKRAMNILQRQD